LGAPAFDRDGHGFRLERVCIISSPPLLCHWLDDEHIDPSQDVGTLVLILPGREKVHDGPGDTGFQWRRRLDHRKIINFEVPTTTATRCLLFEQEGGWIRIDFHSIGGATRGGTVRRENLSGLLTNLNRRPQRSTEGRMRQLYTRPARPVV